jgi:lipopolysaccharide transport system ATP-binding protein
MSDIAIKVENLSKFYQLGEVGTGTISHDLNRWWAKIRGKEDPYFKVGQTNDRTQIAGNNFIWALKDINFEVKQGEVLGIIGRNGAGKSTLLKILSKITSPTTGKIYTKGRIASLLEVGTGFHPEMTGRENMYLNGSILGMRRWEIDKKFDEIVDFAGVEAYVDTPVKRYSSGMYLRLAFAVAAHLEPEILIIDEVLAVGDLQFQKKCVGKIKNVSDEGRTVLFVSHDMTSVSQLCKKAILFKNGEIEFYGHVYETVSKYLGSAKMGSTFLKNSSTSEKINLLKLEIITHRADRININDEIELSMIVRFNQPQNNVHPVIRIKAENGVLVFTSTNHFDNNISDFEIGQYVLKCIIPNHIFNSLTYYLDFIMIKDARYSIAEYENIFSFDVFDDGSTRGDYVGEWKGIVRPLCKWTIGSI